jgi:hypothetical protein
MPTDPRFTAISSQLAARMPTEGIPEAGVAEAIRDTLYAAHDKGILEPVSQLIEQQAKGDEVVVEIARHLRGE